MYICERPEWPHFTWRRERLEPLLGAVRHQNWRGFSAAPPLPRERQAGTAPFRRTVR